MLIIEFYFYWMTWWKVLGACPLVELSTRESRDCDTWSELLAFALAQQPDTRRSERSLVIN